MSVDTMERPMTRREDTPVRISNAALVKIRIAAAYKGKTLSEYISESMLPIAERDIDDEHAKITKQPVKPPKR